MLVKFPNLGLKSLGSVQISSLLLGVKERSLFITIAALI
jgi:hypothetical protein